MAVKENRIYEVGIYCRLSKDDGTESESVSIDTQRSILTDYVKSRGWTVKKIYADEAVIIGLKTLRLKKC